MPRWFLLAICLVLVPLTTRAATIHVPGDFATIQAAIDAAANGDQILIGPGTYDENLVVAGSRSVSLIGTAGADATIVDGGRRGHVLILAGGTVEGLTLRNGRAYQGGGIRLDGQSPTFVRHCVIRDNEASVTGCLDACGEGGGIHLNYQAIAEVVVEDNVISNNHAGDAGGAIFCYTLTNVGTFRNNRIIGNSTSMNAVVILQHGSFVGNLVLGNAGGWDATVSVTEAECRSNTIVANGDPGGAICGYAGATIVRNIVAGNAGQGIVCSGANPPECNDAWDNAGGDFVVGSCDTTGRHNFSADPLFCNATEYTISGDSPCFEAGACETIGAMPAAECGATAARRTTWGALKSLYR